MSLPIHQPAPAKFVHENGTQLRMQCFVLVRDGKERIATLRVQDIDGWCLPAETMMVNESPDQAAARVARTWFKSPLGLQLDRILSFPATGGEDDRWYMLFLYHADAPADLAGTDDTLAIEFHALDDPPQPFGLAHGDVWSALRQ